MSIDFIFGAFAATGVLFALEWTIKYIKNYELEISFAKTPRRWRSFPEDRAQALLAIEKSLAEEKYACSLSLAEAETRFADLQSKYREAQDGFASANVRAEVAKSKLIKAEARLHDFESHIKSIDEAIWIQSPNDPLTYIIKIASKYQEMMNYNGSKQKTINDIINRFQRSDARWLADYCDRSKNYGAYELVDLIIAARADERALIAKLKQSVATAGEEKRKAVETLGKIQYHLRDVLDIIPVTDSAPVPDAAPKADMAAQDAPHKAVSIKDGPPPLREQKEPYGA